MNSDSGLQNYPHLLFSVSSAARIIRIMNSLTPCQAALSTQPVGTFFFAAPLNNPCAFIFS